MIREIKINPVLNGFVVDIGCQKIVFTDAKLMAKKLVEYYTAENPNEVEDDWLSNSTNSKLISARFDCQQAEVST